MTDRDTVREFLAAHRATAVGTSPPRPPVEPADDDHPPSNLTVDAEWEPAKWRPLPLCEAPAGPGEHPEWFVDGSHASQPVLCVRSAQGYPIPLLLAEVGAVGLRLRGRRFDREFAVVERVLGFVAEPFPWEQVERFAAALANIPELALRVLPAQMPDPVTASPFDYDAMRTQAYNRCQNEMLKLEVLALRAAQDLPVLVDGQLGGRIGAKAAAARPLVVGAVKGPRLPALPNRCMTTILDLPPGHRTPYYLDSRTTEDKVTDVPLACWFLRLAHGPRLAPNWGTVRIDVPQVQLNRYAEDGPRSAFVNRLSRWLIDARCRADSYARMPVSLDPIVRAEDALKPLFTPAQVLVNRLYHTAGLFHGRDL